ncbi:hypothetical protein SIID45300_02432 [Candidatus Magnetaquicoccaceae bacterium FCR-1]|uniref:Uncharacterized protein n=1 Tax=Candidatus Magnetaquiglobus chichijimensis TaxID=3141448 RepID=A0ABQ0CB59_9PROT
MLLTRDQILAAPARESDATSAELEECERRLEGLCHTLTKPLLSVRSWVKTQTDQYDRIIADIDRQKKFTDQMLKTWDTSSFLRDLETWGTSSFLRDLETWGTSSFLRDLKTWDTSLFIQELEKDESYALDRNQARWISCVTFDRSVHHELRVISIPLFTPDWSLYRDTPSAPLWHRIAYSLNVSPLLLEAVWRRSGAIRMNFREWLSGCGVAFSERLLIAESAVICGSLEAKGFSCVLPHAHYVDADKFLRWARQNGWRVPDKLFSVAPITIQGSVVHETDPIVPDPPATYHAPPKNKGGRPSGRVSPLTILIEVTYHALLKDHPERKPTAKEILLEIRDHDDEQIIQEITGDQDILWCDPVTRQDRPSLTFRTLRNRISSMSFPINPADHD